MAASLRAVSDTAAADSDPEPIITVVPGEPDGLNTTPPEEEVEKR